MHGNHTVGQILGRRWEEYAQDALARAGEDYPGRDRVVELFGEPEPFEAVVAPFGQQWPGLAATTAAAMIDPEQLAAEVLARLQREEGTEGDAVSVMPRACRSTDVPAIADRHGLPECWSSDVEAMCTVLKSWEERFGTRVLALGPARLIVSVAAPPVTMTEAQAVAAEHFAFSPDTITQGHHDTLRAYAAHAILDRTVWNFWWD
ncbi:DUF4253 domain-containing protein [Streptomyces sp. NRRL S-813]|uniref:DUF4253 domain-containing protein n=1 Tax=Streptomyces sp. NRRL S-813 TaxID=1463919 RepID=UPI0006891F37|nr:DUF4253 domain-containing protein [Streptomyces sp. NRRL S-813]